MDNEQDHSQTFSASAVNTSLSNQMQLAQANYGEWDIEKYTPERYQAFCDFGNRVMAQVDGSGFIWSSGNQFYNDPNVTRIFNEPYAILNLSVWASFDALKAFVFNGAHKEVMQNRDIWLKKLPRKVSVLWWVKAGENPTIEQAKEKLDLLNVTGATPAAFDFKYAYTQEGLPYKANL